MLKCAALVGLLGIGAAAMPTVAQPPSSGALSSPIPRETLDPRAPVKPLDQALRSVGEDRLAAPVLERYEAGDYRVVAQLGQGLLVRAPGHLGLRFAVANSQAWTGDYDGALGNYHALLGTAYDVPSRVGMANVYRWRGEAHRAEPHYKEALVGDPGNKDALEGLALAGRDLRPAVTVRAARTEDNQERRDEIHLSYRQWTDTRTWRLEAGVIAGRHRSPLGAWSPQGLQASAWAPTMALAPQVEAAYYDDGPGSGRLFGALAVQPSERVKVRVGRVHWGRAAFSAAASLDQLTAQVLGLNIESQVTGARLRGRLDAYRVSDDNRVIDGEARIDPLWQPLPSKLAWFGGLYGREAKREDPRYWSPDPAYLLAFVGVQRHWSFDRSELSASVRRGFKLSRSAGDSWSAGVSAKTWVHADLALGLEAWAVDSPRPGRYRMHHLAAFLQRLL